MGDQLIDIVALDIFEGEGGGKGPYRSGHWEKRVGELVEEGETVTCLQYDKTDFDLPAPATGVLVETLVDYPDDIEIGQVIGRIDPRAKPWVFPAAAEPVAVGRCEYCEARLYGGDVRCRNCGAVI